MSSVELQLAINVFKVLSSGDRDLAVETVSPDFLNREAGSGPAACAIPGPAGLLASSAWMRSAFDDLEFPIEVASIDNGLAWVKLRMVGTHARPFVKFREGKVDQVLPSTGRRIDFEQMHLLRVSEVGVESHEAVRDDLTMLTQLAAFPPQLGFVLAMVRGRLTGTSKRAAESVTEAAAEAAALI